MIFGWYIIGYLFVAGVAGGAFFFAFGACVWDRFVQSETSERLVAAVQPGFYISPVLALLAVVLLLLDLGNPDRVFLVALNPFASVMSLGAWLLGLFLLASATLAVIMLATGRCLRSQLLLIGVPAWFCAIGVMTYTGVLLSSMTSVEMWHTPLLTVLFAASSVTTGIAAVLLCGAYFGTAASVKRLGTLWRAGFVASLFEALSLAAFVLSRVFGTPVAAESCSFMLWGPLSVVFWAGICVLGLAVPWTLHVPRPRSSGQARMLVSSVGTLAGGFLLRYCIVAAGSFSPLVLGAVAMGL